MSLGPLVPTRPSEEGNLSVTCGQVRCCAIPKNLWRRTKHCGTSAKMKA